MFPSINSSFDRLDELSEKKVPFVFFIDFLKKNCEIFELSDLKKSGVIVEFPTFTNTDKADFNNQKIRLQSFPQDKEVYRKGFDLVQKNLKAGNSYLVNYTCKTEIEIDLSLKEIFHSAKAKYKVLYKDEFVFFSPETFVEIKNNKIYTHPMKGTIDASVPNAVEVLKNDPKEKAEHYTVVDLLRNDLSIVADEVQLDEFQRIDFLKTQQKNLYAMSSEISGTLKAEFQHKVGSLMKALLPAGSILGAPKLKTLEIILEAETFDRGFYTGVCGYFNGEDFDSCVMIRFIEKENGKFYFKSGGGITHLSKFADEYQEMKNKIYVPIH